MGFCCWCWRHRWLPTWTSPGRHLCLLPAQSAASLPPSLFGPIGAPAHKAPHRFLEWTVALGIFPPLTCWWSRGRLGHWVISVGTPRCCWRRPGAAFGAFRSDRALRAAGWPSTWAFSAIFVAWPLDRWWLASKKTPVFFSLPVFQLLRGFSHKKWYCVLFNVKNLILQKGQESCLYCTRFTTKRQLDNGVF